MKFLYIILISAVVASCGSNDKSKSLPESDETERSHKRIGDFALTNPSAYAEWQQERLADPATGKIPHGIRVAELAFANKLPENNDRSLTWTSRGPYNKGGRTRAIALDIQDENIMLAGGVSGGIWRTTDGGQNWLKTTDPVQMHSVTSIVQDTRAGHEDTWYAGTGEYYGIVSATSFTSQYSGDGLFKSTDGGLTWNELASTASGTPQTLYEERDMDFTWRLVTDHTDPVNDVVLAAVYNGIWRSEDGGQTWDDVLGLDTTVSATPYTDLIITPNGTFYASRGGGGPGKGFYRSDDGINWVNISPTLPSSVGRIAIAFDPQDENVVWWFGQTNGAGTDGHSVWKYRYLSGDGSGSNGVWENKSSGMPNYSCTGFFTFDFGAINTQSSYDVCIAVHPADSNVIYLGGTNIYRTDDQFASSASSDWIGGYRCNASDLSDYVYVDHHPDQHYMTFLPSDPNVMISANDGGVYKTNDNLASTVSWIPLNNGYVTTQFYTVAIEHGDVSSDYLIGGMQDNGTWFTNSVEADTPWVEILRGDGAYCEIPEGRNYYLTSWQQGKTAVQNVDNDGNVVSFERIDPTGGPTQYNFINSFILDPHNQDRFYLNGRLRVWRQDSLTHIPQTNDLYGTESMGWTMLGVSNPGPSGGSITVLEMCENKPNTVWYGSSSGKVFRLDSADSPNVTQTEIANFVGYVSSVSVNPFNEDEILVTISNYNVPSVYYTTDGGQNWTDVGGNLEENTDGTGAGPAFYWAYIYPDGTKFVGTSIGLFSTDNLDGANTTWAMEGASEIGNVVINMVRGRTFDGRIVVATHGNGIYEATTTPVFNSVETNDRIQVNVYPNPTTNTLSFQGIETQSKIDLFSFNGQLIMTLSGRDASRVDVSALKPGTYIYRVKQNGKYTTGRFVKI